MSPLLCDVGAFDPDLRAAARVLPRGLVGPRTLPWLRRAGALAGDRVPTGTQVVRLGPISVRLHHPRRRVTSPAPALLWIHGGGYVLGSPAQDDAVCRTIADELGAVVGAVAYRLAPEHPFPTPLHDCHDALVWLAARPEVDSRRVAIGGASAGGGLAAALALLARDRGAVAPAFQLLSYPMLDDRTATRTDVDERDLRVWDTRSNRFGWEAYLGCTPGSEGVDALAAPARHPDLAGLPPAWIGVGTLDLFLDEDLAHAERLRTAGTPCALTVVEGAFHGFDGLRPRAGITTRFRAAQVAALATAFTPSG